MKAIAESTTVVLAGSFNPAILRPQWVAVHGLGLPEAREFQVEMLAPVGGSGPNRYSFEGLSYSAGFRNVTLHLDGSNLPGCSRALVAAATVLHQLPHTPVSGVGFNFGFLVEDPSDALMRLLTTKGELTDSFGQDAEVVVRRWSNKIKWEGALVSIDSELAGGQVTITFNFHHTTGNAVGAAEILRGENVFVKHQQRAVEAAQALSEQQLEA